MAVTNPYFLQGMMPIDSDMFFGREREMRRIESKLGSDHPQCVSLIGECLIGKSSLAFRVFNRMRNSPNTLAIFPDCDGLSEHCRTIDQFFQLLNRGFREALAERPQTKALPELNADNLFQDYASFIDFVKTCGRKRVKTIIFIDEFEHLPQKEFADKTFFSNLRSAAYNPDHRLAYVTVSGSELKALTPRPSRSSGFWNIFDTQVIGLLDHADINRLRTEGFQKSKLSLTKEEIQKIHAYAGDFPFFNQLACASIWDAKISGEAPDWDSLEVKLHPFYKELWENRSPQKQKLLKTIVNLNFKDDFALKEMIYRGLIIKDDNLYLPFSDHFSTLIDKHFKVTRKKIKPKEIIYYIKEVMGIAKTGKEIIKD
jgi:hypothetical protein